MQHVRQHNQMGQDRSSPTARLVQRHEVRSFHTLGSVLCAFVWVG
eukprot:COSAG02_NODE_17822_length_978_cov_1.564278_1_plen_44_part_10